MNNQLFLPINDELIVDNFAGGGGASTGIEKAFGRPVDIAINHDEQAIAMHQANHPNTLHFCENVFDVDPLQATKGQPVGLAWFSPDCKHFSKAKGNKPVEKKIRGLAWVVIKWAAIIKPRELYRAQGFDDSYIIDIEINSKKLSKAAQVRMCGNSVCPPLSTALVKANFAHEQQYRSVV